MIKRAIFTLVVLVTTQVVLAQPNCNIYKWNNDTLCYQACLEAMQAIEFSQGSKKSQVHFDKAIDMCPTFDYAYFEKAVLYLKRGMFVQWKLLIDKAVLLNPREHLGYRGWCRYQFLRDYEGAIKDIEKLDSLIDYDIGYSINGDYHLNIARALCYKGIGEKKKAIEIIEKQLSVEKYAPLSYDYLHLGILKFETGDYSAALSHLNRQIEINDYLAETYYYAALTHKAMNNEEEYRINIQRARQYYLEKKKMVDPYTNPMDKVYLEEIEREILMTANKK